MELARASAENVDAQALASGSYQSAVALENEARQFAGSGRRSDAVFKALAAEARFHQAETEARSAMARRPGVESAQAKPAAAPSPHTGSPTSEAALTPEAEDDIKGVIAQYVSGLQSRNLPALKRVWPSLSGQQEKALRTEFSNARTVQALFHDPRISVNDGTTTVTGTRTYALETQDGQQLFTTTRTTITMRRVGDEWVIERMVHVP